MSPSNVYLTSAFYELGRLFSWQDREPFSITYGCFDRTYWAWKFTDFPGARFQEAVYSLAHLFVNSYEDNKLHHQPQTLQWARAGLRYWQSLQYRDGSFDEAYPFEHSLAATAFTGFYVGEGYLLLHDLLSADERSSLRQTFARMGNWLCRNDEKHGILSNHLAAGAAALEVIYRICGESRYQKRSRDFLQRIYDHQSPEGWYEEYGGADAGYQTHGTFYLARLWQYTNDASLLDSLRNSLHFLKYCFHPNCTLGGEYGSRNTEFYFPAGFEILAPVLPDAALIAHFMRPAIQGQSVAGLATVDAYNFLPMLNNYLFAAQAAAELPAPLLELPCHITSEMHFPEAGLYFKSTPHYYAVLGISKGGVLKVFYADGQASSDCGYWGQRENSRNILTSQSLNRQQDCHQEGNSFSLECVFVQVNQRIQVTWQFILFRIFTLTLGRFQTTAYWVKNLLVQILVRRRKTSPLRLKRRVEFNDDFIVCHDQIVRSGTFNLGKLYSEPKFSSIHMGSSRYFQPQELVYPPSSEQNWVEVLNREGIISIDKRFP